MGTSTLLNCSAVVADFAGDYPWNGTAGAAAVNAPNAGATSSLYIYTLWFSITPTQALAGNAVITIGNGAGYTIFAGTNHWNIEITQINSNYLVL